MPDGMISLNKYGFVAAERAIKRWDGFGVFVFRQTSLAMRLGTTHSTPGKLPSAPRT